MCAATTSASSRWRANAASASCWRARPGARIADWAAKLGYDRQALADINRRTIALMAQMRDEYETPQTPIVISGNIGPRGDGYSPDRMMSANEAQDYHAEQINVFAGTEADLVSAFTLNYVDEAIGVARAANGRRHAGGDLIHGRDRRQAADRADAEGRHHRDRPEDRPRAGLLHAQLRAPDAFRGCADG